MCSTLHRRSLAANIYCVASGVTVRSCMHACRLPPDQRKIPLATIAARTKLDIDGVEFLLMRAMSLKLVTGTIDEIDATVHTPRGAARADAARDSGAEGACRDFDREGRWRERAARE